MAKSFYRIPEKEIKLAVGELVAEGVWAVSDSGYLLKSDAKLLQSYEPKIMNYDYSKGNGKEAHRRAGI